MTTRASGQASHAPYALLSGVMVGASWYLFAPFGWSRVESLMAGLVVGIVGYIVLAFALDM